MAGGAIGTLLRYYISIWSHRISDSVFPVGTLTVNAAGSLFIGLLWGLTEWQPFSTPLRVFIFVGLLGGFTTFSTFSFETMSLLRDGEVKLALWNVFLNNFAGIGLAVLGYLGGRYLVQILS